MLQHFLPLFLLAPAPPAQVDLFDEAERRPARWPAAITHGATGRMVAGDVTGDLMPDLVLLNGGKPVVVYGPAVHDALFEIDLAANDIALLPGGEGLADRLMVVNDTGLYELTGYDAGEYVTTPVEFEEYEDPEDWPDPTRMVRGDTDGDGKLDLVALAADGDLLFLEDLDTLDPNATEVDLATTVHDMAVVDWNGTGGKEVALLCSNGFFVVTRTGSVLVAIYGACSGGVVVPLRQEGFGRDRCAVVFTTTTEEVLLVVDSTGFDVPVDLTAFDVHGAAAGDVNGDGDDDLWLVSAGDHESQLLVNRSATESYTFDLNIEDAEAIVVGAGSPPSSWTPRPVQHDVDQDGDLDLAVFVAEEGNVAWFANELASPIAGHPVVTGGHYIFYWSEDPHVGHLKLFIEPPANEPFESTGVQVTTWKVPDFEDFESPTEAVAVVNEIFDWDEGETTAHLWFEQEELYSNDLFLNVLRLVRVTSLGVVEVGPPVVHGFATPKDVTDGLFAMFGNELVLRVFEVGAPPAPPYEEVELYPPVLAERALGPKVIVVVPVPPPPPELEPDPDP